MTPQRKLLTPALETGASQPGTGTASMIDVVHGPHEFLSTSRKIMLLNVCCINQEEATPPESQGGPSGN